VNVETDEVLQEVMKVLAGAGQERARGEEETGGGSVKTGGEGGGVESLYTPGIGYAGGNGAPVDLLEQISRLTGELDQLRLTAETQVDGLLRNTKALEENTAAQGRQGGAGSVVGQILSPLAKMSPISPIISGIAKLFGGGAVELPPLTPYIAPRPIRYEVTYGATAGQEMREAMTGAPAGPPMPAPAIQVNVQAVDSRSFLDHSDAIADALREALLRSHPVMDVLRES